MVAWKFLSQPSQDGSPFASFTKEQLADPDFLNQHKDDAWHGTSWATPYTGPCPPPSGPDPKCYEEMENRITISGPLQELTSKWEVGQSTTLVRVTIEFDGAVPPTQVEISGIDELEHIRQDATRLTVNFTLGDNEPFLGAISYRPYELHHAFRAQRDPGRHFDAV